MTVFERIIAKEIPAYTIYEDDLVIAFLDISQATKGHTLIVPKVAYKDIFELNDSISSHLFKVVVKVSKALKKAFHLEGLNVVNNNGVIAGQSVFHYHIHLIPRYPGDDYILKGIDHNNAYSKEDFIFLKNAIITALS